MLPEFCFLWFFLSFSGLEKDPSSSPKQVDFLAGQSLLSQWTGIQASHPLTKSIVLKEQKTGKKNLQLVLQHCCKTSWIAMLRVWPPTFRAVNNLICCKAGLMWVVKCAKLLFNSFCYKCPCFFDKKKHEFPLQPLKHTPEFSPLHPPPPPHHHLFFSPSLLLHKLWPVPNCS